jgi:2-polyprenyl-3-methyl-5-hydroxy-6-metoxy-1,4-benzoquinol methylase
MLVNKLHWASGQRAPAKVFEELNHKMGEFYRNMSTRQSYQDLNDILHESADDATNHLAEMVAGYIMRNGFKSVMEVGCGSGKIYGRLKAQHFNGSYFGFEMAQEVIDGNKQKYPEAHWEAGSVYDKCNVKEAYDCCVAFFVLEHLIYPERALNLMLGTVKKGGALILVCPDFSESGVLPSQKVGLRYSMGAKEKLKKLKLADAIVSLVEARDVRSKLSRVNQDFGPFVINLNPFCLSTECKQLIPDMDAVYISNKKEIEAWAKAGNNAVEYPFGKDDGFSRIVFLVVRK